MSNLRFGLVGLGHWGPNYARLLSGIVTGARLVACADLREERRHLVGGFIPACGFTPTTEAWWPRAVSTP